MLEKIKNFYNSMSNRVLAFFVLIIILFVFWGILFVQFSEEKKNNIGKTEKKIEKTEKKVIFEKQKNIPKKDLTNREKVEKLKRNLRGEKLEKIFNNYEIILKKNKNKIFILLKNNKTKKTVEILNFRNENKNKKEQVNIVFDKIYSSNKEIYIFKKSKLYFYNIETKNLEQINFGIYPKYIKKITNKKYVIVTQKGSFIYDLENKNTEYFYLFKDFVIYKNNYIGIIYSGEKNKKKNLGLEKYNSDILVKYNLETKEKRVILDKIQGFEKIILENKKVYFFSNSKKFVLKKL